MSVLSSSPFHHPIPILYQDSELIVVAKPSGIMVHPWKGGIKGEKTLMNLVKDQTGFYLYPLHRLDRPVSGVVIFGLSKKATHNLQQVWNTQNVVKNYITLCRGHLENKGVFDFPLKHPKNKKIYQEAITEYSPLATFTFPKTTLLKLSIKTGRRHQIRRHFSRRMFNLIGDTMYGKGVDNLIFREKYNLQRIFLHSYRISFPHPYQKNKILDINCPLPSDLTKTLAQMGHSCIHKELGIAPSFDNFKNQLLQNT